MRVVLVGLGARGARGCRSWGLVANALVELERGMVVLCSGIVVVSGAIWSVTSVVCCLVARQHVWQVPPPRRRSSISLLSAKGIK
jgi:hypothetical protein